MTSSLVLRKDVDGIAHLSLNRPEKFNALSHDMMQAIQSHLDDLSLDQAIKVVIIKAKGKAFCTGHDLKEINQSDDQAFHRSLFSQCSKMMLSINQLPKPVIAQINGVATAAGCQLVASCDLAVASVQSTFALSGVNLGLFCSTPAVPVSRNIPQKQAMQMLLTGEFISAKKALEYGLVNDIVPPESLEQRTQKMAQTIADKPQATIALGKEMFYRQIRMDLSTAYQYATERIVCNIGMDEAKEGIGAFLEKRKPKW